MDPEYNTEQATLLLKDAITTNAVKPNETTMPVYAINVRSTFAFTQYAVNLANFFYCRRLKITRLYRSVNPLRGVSSKLTITTLWRRYSKFMGSFVEVIFLRSNLSTSNIIS